VTDDTTIDPATETLPETDGDFRRDLIDGLSAPYRRIPSKHLYDHRGAELFERICELPE
jgi:L-histidine Nalpha-methyltransferase